MRVWWGQASATSLKKRKSEVIAQLLATQESKRAQHVACHRDRNH